MTVTNTQQVLPCGFEALKPFLDSWGALETSEQRYLLRQKSRMADLQAFYDAVAPCARDALDHLDGFPVDAGLPPPEDALFRLLLGLTEATRSVEIYHEPSVPFVETPHHVKVAWNDGTR